MTATIETTAVEFTRELVPVALAHRIQTKAAAIAKRLAKLGAPAPTVTFGPETRVTETTEAGFEVAYDVFEFVTVTGVEARFAGWTPVAALDHTLVTADDVTEALVAKFPSARADDDGNGGIDLPERFRFSGPVCDHCGVDRQRNTTVVLVNDDGEWTQVGSSCLVEFLGVDPANVLWLVEQDNSFGLDDDEFVAPPALPTAVDFVAVAAEATRVFGFVRAAEPGSTRDFVVDIFNGRLSKRNKAALADSDFDIDRGRAAAAEVIDWVLADTSGSDYMRSASLAVRTGVAVPKTYGLLASLPAAAWRASDAAAAAAERAAQRAAERAGSQLVGAVGDKLVAVGEILAAVSVATQFGTSRRVTLRTDDGNLFTTFGSGGDLFDVDAGDRVEWRGTVKGHESSEQWGNQTVFTRVKLLPPLTADDKIKVVAVGDTVTATDRWLHDAVTTTVTKITKRDDRYVYHLDGVATGAQAVTAAQLAAREAVAVKILAEQAAVEAARAAAKAAHLAEWAAEDAEAS